MKVSARYKIIIILFLILCKQDLTSAQCINQVTHLGGTVVINGVSVTVTTSGIVDVNSVYCSETLPYFIGYNSISGNGNGSYIFNFSPAIDSLQLNVSGISYIPGFADERIVLKKNGTHYPIPQVGTQSVCDALAVLTPEGDIQGCLGCSVSGWKGTTIAGPVTSLEVRDSIVLGPPNGSIFSLYIFSPCITPVKFVYCNAKKTADNSILNWQTSFEQNSSGYQIERSTDGINFITLGTVKSGNSPLGGNYTFLDEKPVFGINYYRIDAIDLDGKITYCGINTVRFTENKKEINVYPIPTTGPLTIEGKPGSKTMDIEIIDVSGKIVLHTITGSNTANLSIEKLSSGIYTLKIFDEHDVHYQKIVKQ